MNIVELPSESHELVLRVNGESRHVVVESRESLLDVLRERFGLTGTKKGCNQGACGACTVLVDGERMNSCFGLAVQFAGCDIQTIEGLARDRELHPLQRAFIQHDGFQCGYCTPGQICSGIAMLQEFRDGMPSAAGSSSLTLSLDEVKERMSGNICRCGAYVGIREALMDYVGQESAQRK